MAVILIDTNILVYAHDRAEAVKQQQAIAVLRYLQQTSAGRLSCQSLAEFFVAVTRGRAPILPPEVAARQVEHFAQTWPVMDITPFVVLEASRGVLQHMLSYWDAQLWAVARLNQIPLIFSEDFSSGTVLDGVRIMNPFSANFVIEDWA